MFFGVTEDKVFAYVAAAGSGVAQATLEKDLTSSDYGTGLLREIVRKKALDPKAQLLAKLRDIAAGGWYPSQRLNKHGQLIPYTALNGGGYTLESLFGIIPNGNATPDYMGWELKAFSRTGRITLMTPEPDSGFYGTHGVEAFLKEYGRRSKKGDLYFTGTHKVDKPSTTSKHTLTLAGFDHEKEKVIDVSGGIQLVAPDGEISAAWSFARLIEHWGRKHAAAAYIPYEKSKGGDIRYRYSPSVLLGEGTEFRFLMKALADQVVIYDPAPKLEEKSNGKNTTKARSQFRIHIRDVKRLYVRYGEVDVSTHHGKALTYIGAKVACSTGGATGVISLMAHDGLTR